MQASRWLQIIIVLFAFGAILPAFYQLEAQTLPLGDSLLLPDGVDPSSMEENLSPEELAKRLSSQKEKPGIIIENASEGEFLKGEEDERGLLILRGRIRVRFSGGLVTADTVIVDVDRKEIYAEGNLVYRTSADSETASEIRAERFIYDQRLGSGIVYNADGYASPVHFIGKSVQLLNERSFSVSHSFFTTCAAEVPHYNFTARKLWVFDDSRVIAVGVMYYVGGVPMIPLPFLYTSDWGTGLITQAGYSKIQGFFLQTTYQFSDPTAYTSSWRPLAYRFMYDYYKNTGQNFGIEMFRFSPDLNYYLHLAGANFKEYQLISDYREKNKIRVTNQIHRPDGTIGKEYHNWYKAFAILNYKGYDAESNSTRNVMLRFEDYSHRMYEFEFGSRYQPTSTIPALYQNSESGRGLVRDSTSWNLVWTEVHDDLSIRVGASRDNQWYETGDYDTSEYVPVTDILPSIDIQKNVYLGRLDDLGMSFYWDNKLHTDLTKNYSGGSVFRTYNFNQFETSLRTYYSFYPFFTLRPRVGYGAQKMVPKDADESFTRQAEYQSYEYVFTEDTLTMGPDFLYLEATYRKKQSFAEDRNYNPLVNTGGYDPSEKVNETEVSLQFNPITDIHMSVESVYDHRDFPEKIPERQRWYYPVYRTDIYFNFFNLFGSDRENLLSRKKIHFMGLRFTNDYIYDMINKRDHSNVFGVSFETGGFDLWILKRLRYFEMSYYWYHVYYNRELDHMRYSFKMDLRLTQHWYLQMEMESRTTAPERYLTDSTDENGDSDYIAAEHDILYSTGVAGQERRQNSVFNTGYYEAAFILDLHDWEMRFGYSMEQRSLYAGVNSFDVVNFYDNRVFFSMTLMRFDIEGISEGRPSKYILNRERVRPGDLGTIPMDARRF